MGIYHNSKNVSINKLLIKLIKFSKYFLSLCNKSGIKPYLYNRWMTKMLTNTDWRKIYVY